MSFIERLSLAGVLIVQKYIFSMRIALKIFAGYIYTLKILSREKFRTCCIRTYALYGTRARLRKCYSRKFVSEQNLAKLRNI